MLINLVLRLQRENTAYTRNYFTNVAEYVSAHSPSMSNKSLYAMLQHAKRRHAFLLRLISSFPFHGAASIFPCRMLCIGNTVAAEHSPAQQHQIRNTFLIGMALFNIYLSNFDHQVTRDKPEQFVNKNYRICTFGKLKIFH